MERRTMFISLFIVAAVLLCGLVSGIIFVSFYSDPMINYYGVRLRQSELNAILQTQTPGNPNFGLHCIAHPFPNLYEGATCFDSREELEDFIKRRNEVNQQRENLR